MYVPSVQTVADLTVTGTMAHNFMRGLPPEVLEANRKREARHGEMYNILADACYSQKRMTKAIHMNYIEGGWSRSVFVFSDRSVIVCYTDYDHEKLSLSRARDFAVATSEEFLPIL